MALTRKDLYATLLVAAGILLAVSVVEGWGWPLMNGVRMGIVALLLFGTFACAASGWATPDVKFTGPFMIAAVLVGALTVIAAVVGLFANTVVFLEIVMAGLVLLWLITTMDRMLVAGSAPRPTPAS